MAGRQRAVPTTHHPGLQMSIGSDHKPGVTTVGLEVGLRAVLFWALGIERFVDDQGQIVKGQCQLSVKFNRFFIELGAFQAPGGSPISVGQSGRLIGIPQAAQEFPDLLRPRASRTNHAQCLGMRYAMFCKFLKQETLKIPAMARARTVNAAPAAIESRARLQES
jgi:hypothetical protein